MARNLCVFCDGTWNTPEQTENNLPSPTNVVKLYNLALQDDVQLRYYHPGVGAEGGLANKVLGGGLGAGLSRNIKSAYEWLCRNYQPDDRIFLFGFSRGAYTVRSLAGFVSRGNLLDLSGLSPKDIWGRIDQVYLAGYRSAEPAKMWPQNFKFVDQKPVIHFVGVWDTVGALGVPDDMVLLDQLIDNPVNYRFHDTRLSNNVLHARHAVAMDEWRASFAPTLWDAPEDRPASHSFRQIWFPGTHCDVGGGHADSGLSDCALRWMLDEAAAQGLRINPTTAAQIRPDPRGVLHDSVTGLWKHMRTQPRGTPRVTATPANSELAPEVLERHSNPPLAQAPYWPTLPLEVGGTARIDVFARPHWNSTGIYLEAGARYEFRATGIWIDSAIECPPQGAHAADFHFGKLIQNFGSLLGEAEAVYHKLTGKKNADWWGTKRVEEADWFELVGMVASRASIDGQGTPDSGEIVRIGKGTTIVPKSSGYLYCFANDAWKFYDNNRGKVALEVTRVA